MHHEYILTEIEDSVAVITLNRPEHRNALIPEMRLELLEAVDAVDNNPEVRAVIITGAGDTFCAGGDVNAMHQQTQSGGRRDVQDVISPVRNQIVLRLRQTIKPFIAAINGACAGGGLGLALACDIRLASDNAKFSLAFGRLGLHPEWGVSYFLPRLVGLQRANELIWSSARFSAAEARDMGLILRIAEQGAVYAEAMQMARRFTSGAPVAIQLAKKAMRNALDISLEDALDFESYAQGVVLSGEDFQEGLRAFRDKRKPSFTGR